MRKKYIVYSREADLCHGTEWEYDFTRDTEAEALDWIKQDMDYSIKRCECAKEYKVEEIYVYE